MTTSHITRLKWARKQIIIFSCLTTRQSSKNLGAACVWTSRLPVLPTKTREHRSFPIMKHFQSSTAPKLQTTRFTKIFKLVFRAWREQNCPPSIWTLTRTARLLRVSWNSELISASEISNNPFEFHANKHKAIFLRWPSRTAESDTWCEMHDVSYTLSQGMVFHVQISCWSFLFRSKVHGWTVWSCPAIYRWSHGSKPPSPLFPWGLGRKGWRAVV